MSGQILFFWSANLVQVLFAVRMRKSIGQINQEWKFLSEKVQIPFCRFRTEWATEELNQISPIQHATNIWTANKSWGKDGSFLLLCAKGEDSESWVFLILFQFIFPFKKNKNKTIKYLSSAPSFAPEGDSVGISCERREHISLETARASWDKFL